MENEDNKIITIPYVVYESQQERNDKQHKRLWILCIILIFALIASNLAWIIYESQFETVTEDTSVIRVDQQADEGSNNSVIGDSYYGYETNDNGNENAH